MITRHVFYIFDFLFPFNAEDPFSYRRYKSFIYFLEPRILQHTTILREIEIKIQKRINVCVCND